MKLNSRESILKEYKEILAQLEDFIKTCNNSNTFSLSGKLYQQFKQPIQELLESIRRFNYGVVISGEKEVKLNTIATVLNHKICEIPDLNELLSKHSKHADIFIGEYEKKRDNFEKLSSEEKNNILDIEHSVYVNAKKVKGDKDFRERYKILNSEISEVKLILNEKKGSASSNILTIAKQHNEDEKINKLCIGLVDLRYIDDENVKLFKLLLQGKILEKVIDWNSSQADITRLFIAINKLLGGVIKWKELEKLITINGKKCQSLKTGASSKRHDLRIENLVKISFKLRTL